MENNEDNGNKAEEEKSFYYDYSERERFNLGRIFLGAVIIFAGLYFLAQNAGLVPSYIKLGWDKIWPLFLIFIGLSMINFRGWLGAVLGVLAVLILLAVILALFFLSAGGVMHFRGLY
jgi:uncharacterized protein YybS (DUF2232 family)